MGAECCSLFYVALFLILNLRSCWYPSHSVVFPHFLVLKLLCYGRKALKKNVGNLSFNFISIYYPFYFDLKNSNIHNFKKSTTNMNFNFC